MEEYQINEINKTEKNLQSHPGTHKYFVFNSIKNQGLLGVQKE